MSRYRPYARVRRKLRSAGMKRSERRRLMRSVRYLTNYKRR